MLLSAGSGQVILEHCVAFWRQSLTSSFILLITFRLPAQILRARMPCLTKFINVTALSA